MSGPAKEAAHSLGELSKSAHGAKGILAELAGDFVKVVEPAEVLKGAFEGVGEGIKSIAGGFKSGEIKEVVMGVAESLAGLAQMLDLVVPGLGQIASAAIKVGGAFAAMTVGIVQAGAEMAIEATLGKNAMVTMFAALGGGREEGEKTEEMLGGLSEKIGLTKNELAPLAQSFMAMGIEGTEALEHVTLAAASAQAIMGSPAAANAFSNLTKKIETAIQTSQGLKVPLKGLGSLADMGLRVEDVAKRMNISSEALAAQLKAGSADAAKFGDALQDALIEKGAGPMARMGLSFGAMKKMFGQSVEDMFEDMSEAVEPFMLQLKDLLSIFGQSSNSGKVMKSAIGGAFSFILKSATPMILHIKHFFQDVIIWSLKSYIFLKKHWSEVKIVLTGVGVILGTIAAGLVLVSALIVGPFVIAGAIIWGLAAALVGAWVAVAGFVADTAKAAGAIVGGLIQPIKDTIKDALTYGSEFVNGFIEGITAKIGAAKDAAIAMGKSALDGVKGILGISSPSKVMFQLGGWTAEPFAAGIKGGAGAVESASADLGSAAVMGSTSGLKASDYKATIGASSDSKSTGKSGGASISGIVINITAPDGVTNAHELTESAIATIFERIALQQGL